MNREILAVGGFWNYERGEAISIPPIFHQTYRRTMASKRITHSLLPQNMLRPPPTTTDLIASIDRIYNRVCSKSNGIGAG